MKTTITLTAIIAVAFLNLGGCASTGQTLITPENAHTATVVLVTGWLSNQTGEREKKACQLYAAAVAIRSFAEGGDSVPTPDQLRNAILTFLPKAGNYVQFADIIRNLWISVLPKIGGNTKVAIQWAEAIATGIESSSKPYCGPQPYGTPIHDSTPAHWPPGADGTPNQEKTPGSQ